MSIDASNSLTQQQTAILLEVQTTRMANTQQELEGQMALSLIQSAMPTSDTTALPTTASSGNLINIRV